MHDDGPFARECHDRFLVTGELLEFFGLSLQFGAFGTFDTAHQAVGSFVRRCCSPPSLGVTTLLHLHLRNAANPGSAQGIEAVDEGDGDVNFGGQDLLR
jgi:hypothetical protein